MSAETRTLGEMRDSLIERATADTEFRSRLLADPKAVVKEELGFDLPSDFTVEVHEEKLGTAHLVLPPADVLDETEFESGRRGASRRLHRCPAAARLVRRRIRRRNFNRRNGP